MKKGRTAFCIVTENEKFRCFQDLKDTFVLKNQDFFFYIKELKRGGIRKSHSWREFNWKNLFSFLYHTEHKRQTTLKTANMPEEMWAYRCKSFTYLRELPKNRAILGKSERSIE